MRSTEDRSISILRPFGRAERAGERAHEPRSVGGWRSRTAVRPIRLAPHAADPLPPDVAFLARDGVPQKVLELAAQLAAARGSSARQELFATGFDRGRYWSVLADDLGLTFVADLAGASLQVHPDTITTQCVRFATSVLVLLDGCLVLVLAPEADEFAMLRERLRSNPSLADRLVVAAPEAIRALLLARRRNALSNYAITRLARVLPRLSARSLGGSQQLRGPTTLLAAAAGFALLSPSAAMAVLSLLLTVFFTNCSVWKLAAALRRPSQLRLEPTPCGRLPTYTVLVPLYREARVVGDLIARLAAIDYPGSKLQIILLLEADDQECREAVARHSLPATFEVIVVPPAGPRTKPKALTYALPFARGDLVVVFDAEDRPQPDQLRKAAAAFRERPDLGCVQARLAPDNSGSWFARMFTLEYAGNFEILLPALSSWRVPLPLGGTSNHFPRRVLERVGGWDPYNVTEDADLGVRLARFGYPTATILSRTYEEAPVAFRQWLAQRRRWIKGWIQTAALCVGARVPVSLRLPLRERLALHGILTGGVLGLLLYPLSLALILYGAIEFAQGIWPRSAQGWVVVGLNCGNLVAILAAASLTTWRGLRLCGRLGLAWHIPLLPFYWALMSVAAWQALLQFFRDPSGWEKTPHGVAVDRMTPEQEAYLG